jgi:hypothetical protein
MDEVTGYGIRVDAVEEIQGRSASSTPQLGVVCTTGSADMRLWVKTGQVVDYESEGSSKRVKVRTRVDKEPAQAEEWLVLGDMSTVFPYQDNNVSRVRSLESHSRYLVQIPIYPSSSAVAEFPLEGLYDKLSWLVSRCSLAK